VHPIFIKYVVFSLERPLCFSILEFRSGGVVWKQDAHHVPQFFTPENSAEKQIQLLYSISETEFQLFTWTIWDVAQHICNLLLSAALAMPRFPCQLIQKSS
jgi:hypothetical protein